MGWPEFADETPAMRAAEEAHYRLLDKANDYADFLAEQGGDDEPPCYDCRGTGRRTVQTGDRLSDFMVVRCLCPLGKVAA